MHKNANIQTQGEFYIEDEFEPGPPEKYEMPKLYEADIQEIFQKDVVMHQRWVDG